MSRPAPKDQTQPGMAHSDSDSVSDSLSGSISDSISIIPSNVSSTSGDDFSLRTSFTPSPSLSPPHPPPLEEANDDDEDELDSLPSSPGSESQELDLEEDDDDEDEEDETDVSTSDAEQEWKESLQQIELILTMVIVPYLGRYFGRRCAYWSESSCLVFPKHRVGGGLLRIESNRAAPRYRPTSLVMDDRLTYYVLLSYRLGQMDGMDISRRSRLHR